MVRAGGIVWSGRKQSEGADTQTTQIPRAKRQQEKQRDPRDWVSDWQETTTDCPLACSCRLQDLLPGATVQLPIRGTNVGPAGIWAQVPRTLRDPPLSQTPHFSHCLLQRYQGLSEPLEQRQDRDSTALLP